MANFSKVAEEVFEIIRSFDYTVEMFDEDNKRVIEPEDARRFFCKIDGPVTTPRRRKFRNMLVSVIDDDDDSRINLFYGKSTHASDIMGLSTALRQTANKYALIYKAQQFGKEIEPKDISSIVASIVENKQDKNMIIFEKAPPGKKAERFIKKHKAEFKKRYGDRGTEVLYATAWKKFGEGVEFDSPLIEGMYGTSRSSYLKLEHARMIVRHSQKIDENKLGARSRCIEHIFIENTQGERILFPSTALAPARAMTQHVNNGGSFQDKLGETIINMTEEYSHLGKMSRHVKRHSAELQEGAASVFEACKAKIGKLRKTFSGLAKENTYATEAASVLERANMLAEAKPIDETKLSELRQMLNDADLPREVYECAAKAMDECKEEQPMLESRDYPSGRTVGVLGRRVDAKAWENFTKGQLDLTGPIESIGEFRTPIDELRYKLGEIANKARDLSLGNLLHFVGDKLGDSSIRGTDMAKNVIKISRHALKSAGVPLEESLAENNSIIKKHMSWLDRFDIGMILSEDRWEDMNRYENDVEEAENYAIDNFMPEEFLDSDEFKHDIGNYHNPNNPEENKVSRDEIISTLTVFLAKFIEVHWMGNGESHDSDLTDVAKTVYPKVADLMHAKGYIIEDSSLTENLNDDPNKTLDMEDVLIPTGNMGDSLAHEAGKKVVDNPDTNGVTIPDDDYVARIQTLAGLNQGQNTGRNNP